MYFLVLDIEKNVFKVNGSSKLLVQMTDKLFYLNLFHLNYLNDFNRFLLI